MSLFSLIVFIIIILLTTVKSDIQREQSQNVSSVLSFKEYMASVIKEQSSKMQALLKKIQTNAQSVLKKIARIKVDRTKTKKADEKIEYQVEPPPERSYDATESSRGYGSLFTTTGYPASGSGGYGMGGSGMAHGGGHGGGVGQTYHHHSIGLDPVNLLVSVSLLSFLLTALNGLLSGTRLPLLPTPVVQARSLNDLNSFDLLDWLKKYNQKVKPMKYEKYSKKKYPKKYYLR
ncbi:hypothetical protein O0L34_g5593 [Tuta absoluta]|nr:hypothetical protein O0L34_g5593 [Tuta absoluta]